MNYGWHDVLGTAGVMMVLVTYLMLQLQKLSARSAAYSSFNAVGALFILISLSQDFNLPAFLIEASWLAISMYGLIRTLLARRMPST